MKHLVRSYLFYLVALFLSTQVFGDSFKLPVDLKTWLIAAGILSLLNLLLKPILNLLLLPITLLTLGLFSFVINAAVFYLFLQLAPEVTISAWTFPGITIANFALPAFALPYLGTLIAVSVLVSVSTNFLAYLVE